MRACVCSFVACVRVERIIDTCAGRTRCGRIVYPNALIMHSVVVGVGVRQRYADGDDCKTSTHAVRRGRTLKLFAYWMVLVVVVPP